MFIVRMNSPFRSLKSYSFTEGIGVTGSPIIGFWFDFMFDRSDFGGLYNAQGESPKLLQLAYV